MIKLLPSLLIRIVTSLIIGFLYAGFSTRLHLPCNESLYPANERIAVDCVAVTKAVSEPDLLFHNEQDSLKEFTRSYIFSSLVVFTAMSAIDFAVQLHHKQKHR